MGREPRANAHVGRQVERDSDTSTGCASVLPSVVRSTASAFGRPVAGRATGAAVPVAQPTTTAFALAAAAAAQPTAAVSVATSTTRCFAAIPPQLPGRWRQLSSAGATSTQNSSKRKLILSEQRQWHRAPIREVGARSARAVLAGGLKGAKRSALAISHVGARSGTLCTVYPANDSLLGIIYRCLAGACACRPPRSLNTSTVCSHRPYSAAIRTCDATPLAVRRRHIRSWPRAPGTSGQAGAPARG